MAVVLGTLKNSSNDNRNSNYNLIRNLYLWYNRCNKTNQMRKQIDFSVLIIGAIILMVFALSSCGGGRRVGCPINAVHSFGTGRI